MWWYVLLASVLPLQAAADPGCTAYITSFYGVGGSLTLEISRTDIDGYTGQCQGSLVVNGFNTGETFDIVPGNGNDPGVFYYTVPDEYTFSDPTEYAIETDLETSPTVTYPPRTQTNQPCTIIITSAESVTADDGYKTRVIGTAPSVCGPLDYYLQGPGDNNAEFGEAAIPVSDGNTFDYTSQNALAAGKYIIQITAVSPPAGYTRGTAQDSYTLGPSTPPPATSGCQSSPTVTDISQTSQGLTISVICDVDGVNDCVNTLVINGQDSSAAFVISSNDEIQYVIPANLVPAGMNDYAVSNDQGTSNSVVYPPYIDPQPQECQITITSARSVSGPSGGFLTLATGSAPEGCNPLDYYIDNNDGGDGDSGTTSSNSNNIFQFTTTKELPAGSYQLAVAAPDPNDSSHYLPGGSNLYDYKLGGPESSLRRRRLVCAWDEQPCYNAKGRVQDLDSNIERCGSCHGPDCTEIPFANSVRCELGSCVVESCLEGYTLDGNACFLGGAVGQGLLLQA